MRNKLNINNQTQQFDSVSFVNEMTQYQLKVLVKRMFENFHDLANTLDNCDPTVANIIDAILSGNSWKSNDLNERFRYMYHNNEAIAYDSVTNTFTVMNCKGSTTEYNAMRKNELVALFKPKKVP